MSIRNFLWQPTRGYWLFWASAIYLLVGAINIFADFAPLVVVQIVWLVILSIPLWCGPVKRRLK